MKRFISSVIISFLFCGFAFGAVETAEIIYAKAYANIYKNNSKTAIALFEKGIATYPDCAFLYAGLGDIYLKEENYAKALDCYTNAQRKKNALDVYKIDFYNASLKKNMSDIDNALSGLFILGKSFDNPVIYKNINFILNEQYLNTILLTDIYANSADEKLTTANTYKQAGDKETALKEYLKLISANPKNFQAANNAGVIFLELKDHTLSEKYLKLAKEVNPHSALILNNLAILSLRQKKYNEMQTYFEEAEKINSNYFPVLNNKLVAKIHSGINYYQTKNVDTILDIIKKDNENVYAMRTLSKMYFLKGDFNSADILLNSLNSSYNFKLYTQKAYTSYKNDNLQNALAYINKAISLYSDNSIDYVIRGRIHTATGQYDKAIDDFNKAMQKNKNNTLAYYYVSQTYYKAGRIDEASSRMKEFLSLKKGNPQTQNLKLLFE